MAELFRRLFAALPALAAVLTLPIGILTALFFGLWPALVVFVVGWLGLVPLFGILDQQLRIAESHESDDAATATEPDPLDTLRERYARGEIDEIEFERRVEGLIGTEDGPEGIRSVASDDRGESVDEEMELESE